MNKVTKAVIPAAGFGTRFLPFTKAVPKEMLPIIDTPTIEYIVKEAIESGIKDILIIISEGKECIKTYFGKNGDLEQFLTEKGKTQEVSLLKRIPSDVRISYIYQKEQLGLGHAVLCAKEFIGNEPFALLLGDDLYVGEEEPVTKQLIQAFEKTNSTILGTLEVAKEDISKYGICSPKEKKMDRLVELNGVIEKPKAEEAPSNLAIGGRYVLTSTIFKYLQSQQRGAGGEIQLTDSIMRLMVEEKVYSLAVAGKRYDLGSKKGFLEATVDFALKREDLKPITEDILNNKKGL